MNITNTQTHGVYVKGHGVVQAGKSAKVRDSATVKQLVKAGVLSVDSEKETTKEAAK